MDILDENEDKKLIVKLVKENTRLYLTIFILEIIIIIAYLLK